jgi:hypothetical protein
VILQAEQNGASVGADGTAVDPDGSLFYEHLAGETFGDYVASHSRRWCLHLNISCTLPAPWLIGPRHRVGVQ